MPVTEKQLEMLKDKQTLVIIPATGIEGRLAMDFLKANAPSVVKEQRVYEELHLLALQGGIRTTFVFRDPSTPVHEQFVRTDGALSSKQRPTKELMDEMLISHSVEPEFVREHPLRPAILNVSGYLERVGKALAPHIRLDFIDKGEVKPQVLRLEWT